MPPKPLDTLRFLFKQMEMATKGDNHLIFLTHENGEQRSISPRYSAENSWKELNVIAAFDPSTADECHCHPWKFTILGPCFFVFSRMFLVTSSIPMADAKLVLEMPFFLLCEMLSSTKSSSRSSPLWWILCDLCWSSLGLGSSTCINESACQWSNKMHC